MYIMSRLEMLGAILLTIILLVYVFGFPKINLGKMVGGGSDPEPYEEADRGTEIDFGGRSPVLAATVAPVLASNEPEKVVDNAQIDVAALPRPQQSNNSAPLGGFEPELSALPADQLKPEELLPRDDNYSAWTASNPAVQGSLADKNYLPSGHHFGINTVGQSLRNANRGLRTDPPIPMREVGPWNQTTIEADTNRRILEIGSS
jgi:hypothetical protein